MEQRCSPAPTRCSNKRAPHFRFGSRLCFPGLTVTGSIGLLAPAGTPSEIIEQIAQASRRRSQQNSLANP
jgi:hypothetical protein